MQIKEELTEAAVEAGGWTDWRGGECPVDLETVVDIRLASGDEDGGKATTFYWDHDGDGADIVAYRVVPADQLAEPEKQPQPGEWWEAVIDGETVILWLFEIPGSGLRWVDFSDAVDAVDCGHVEFIRHLPNCDGFDYVLPREQTPAKWFRVTDDEREGWCQSVGTHFNVVWDDGDCTPSIVDLSYKGIRKADAPNEYSGPIVAHKRERKGGAE